MLRIVILVETLSRNTGGLSSALDLINTLDDLGFRPIVCLERMSFCTKNSASNSLLNAGVRRILVPRALREAYSPAGGGKVKQAIKEMAFFFRGDSQRFFRAIKKADVIIDCQAPSPTRCSVIKSVSSAKLVRNHAGSVAAFSEYFIPHQERCDSAVPSNKKTRLGIYQELMSEYDCGLFQSVGQMCESESLIKKWASKSFTLLPTCQESAIIEVQQQPSIWEDKHGFHIVCVGSLQPRKNQELAIKALNLVVRKRSEKVWLHFVGSEVDERYALSLRKTALELGVRDKVLFHGHRGDYLKFIVNASVVLQTSLAEGVSRILREAMFAKRAIIASHISGTGELLRDYESALFGIPGSVESFAEHLLRLLDDKELRSMLGNNAFRRYMLRHSNVKYRANVSKMVEFFRDL